MSTCPRAVIRSGAMSAGSNSSSLPSTARSRKIISSSSAHRRPADVVSRGRPRTVRTGLPWMCRMLMPSVQRSSTCCGELAADLSQPLPAASNVPSLWPEVFSGGLVLHQRGVDFVSLVRQFDFILAAEGNTLWDPTQVATSRIGPTRHGSRP